MKRTKADRVKAKKARRAKRQESYLAWREAKQVKRQDRISGLEPRPELGHDQVYICNGKKYHTCWCTSMNGIWLDGANTIRAVHVDEAQAAGLDHCGYCASYYAASQKAVAEMDRHFATI